MRFLVSYLRECVLSGFYLKLVTKHVNNQKNLSELNLGKSLCNSYIMRVTDNFVERK